MKNNVLTAFVIFFTVVACLLIVDDLTYSMQQNNNESSVAKNTFAKQDSENLATLDLETED